MRKMIRGRILAGILAAVLMCTTLPETAYAIEQQLEIINENVEGDKPSMDEEIPEDGNVSGNDLFPDDVIEAGEQEEEQPSDEETEEAEGEGVETEVSEEETLPNKMTAYQISSARAATETIAQLKVRFPAGMYWNCVNLAYNNPDGVTGTPCPNNHDTAPNTCNNYRGCAQCRGFAYRLADGYYGSCPLDGWSAGSLDSLKAGDIIIYGTGTWGHTIWVTGVNGDTISFADCNADYHCGIRWDATTTKANIRNSVRNVYSAPYSITVVPQDHGGYWEEGFYPVIPDGDYHIVSALGDQWWLTNGGFSTDNGGNVQLWEYNDMECDHHLYHFEFIPDGKGIGRGFYKVTNKHSGKCLDSEGGHEYLYNQQTGRRTNVWQWEDNGGGAQQWAINEIDGGDKGMLYTFYARCSGYVMDVEDGIAASGTNISMWKDNGSAAQQWRLIPWAPYTGRTIGDGEYQIVPFSTDDKVVSVAGDSPINGTNVELNSNKGDYRHTFDVKYEGNGYYSIINKNSGLSLDVEGGAGSRKLGANIQLWERDTNSSAQKWIIKDSGNGYYNVISKCNGLYLDVQGGGVEDGCNIGLYKPSDFNTYLKWKFVPYQKHKIDAPTADISSGTEVEAGTEISLSCGVEGATIYYTLDGTDPLEQSILYAAPIVVTENMTIKAIAVKEGYQDSDTAVFSYTVKRQAGDGGEDVPREEIPKEDMPDDGVIPEGLWVAGLSKNDYVYTGKAIKPVVRVYDHKTLLKEKTDYTISYIRNTKAYGYASGDQGFDAKKAPTITVTAKGNYSGKETLTFKILSLDIGSPAFAADDMTIAYKTKGIQKPVPVLMWKDKKLNNKTDYTVTYYDSSNNKLDSVKEPGVYYVEMTGKGNFGGVRRVKLTVTGQLKLMSKMFAAGIKGQPYTGSAITPTLTVKDGKTTLAEGTHYTVSYSRNTAVGTAYAIVTGTEEAGYSGTKRISFKITGTPITKAAVTGLSEQKYFYEGTDITPQIQLSVKANTAGTARSLILGTDYTVAWQKNRNAGTATVIITGKGGYTGTLKKTFRIGKFDIGANADGRFTVELKQETVPYAKGSAKPTVVVKFRKSDGSWQTLTEGQDYTLSYRNHTAVNNGSRTDKRPTVTVKGKGNFSGTFGTALSYQIAAQDIGQLTLTAQDRTYQNKKNIYATKVTITDLNGKTLKAGTDYSKSFTYTYKNETVVISAMNYGTTVRAAGDFVDRNDIIPAGTVLVVQADAKAGSNYTGIATGEYRITQAAISAASVSIPKQTYTGREIILDKSQITVKMKGNPIDQSQYEIVPGSYKNNVKKGTASVTIRGIGNYGGTKTVKFSIGAKGFLWWWK